MKGAGILGFIFGFASGAVATYFYLKSKEEMVEYKPEEDKKESSKKSNEFYRPSVKNDYDRAVSAARDASFTKPIVSYSESYNETVETKKDELESSKEDNPRSIQPSYYGDNPEYSTFTLRYFKDGVLIDDQNNPLDDPDDVLGPDFVDHIGEFEEDVAYIRNDRLKSDFMILFVDYDFMDR